jgi:hypothetical protein
MAPGVKRLHLLHAELSVGRQLQRLVQRDLLAQMLEKSPVHATAEAQDLAKIKLRIGIAGFGARQQLLRVGPVILLRLKLFAVVVWGDRSDGSRSDRPLLRLRHQGSAWRHRDCGMRGGGRGLLPVAGVTPPDQQDTQRRRATDPFGLHGSLFF